MMYEPIKKILFSLPPETSHTLSLKSLSFLNKAGLIRKRSPKTMPVNLMGLHFPNPVGLAAGLDKNGDYIDALSALGFGFVEVGTITPKPQKGNPAPRLFRLVPEQAIINRMGFNNKGVDYLLARIKKSHYNGILGINIGKNRDTPADRAIDDYLHCMKKVYSHASYITINLSSPNTPGLRDLQFGDALKQLLHEIKKEQNTLAKLHNAYKPVTIKIAPDMAEEDLESVAYTLKEHGMDGVIATNTTVDKSAVANSQHASESGGLSGAPLTDKSTKTIKILNECLQGKIPVIGVGGIMSAKDAMDKINAGASAIQIYSGLIYQGPDFVSRLCNEMEMPCS